MSAPDLSPGTGGPVLGAALGDPRFSRRAGRWVRRQVTRRPSSYELLDVDAPADVVVYFGDDLSRAYQLQQWLPALERLAEVRPVVLVVRRGRTARWVAERTRLPVVYVPTLRQLMALYADHDYKVAVYVNHSRTNFQSLMAADVLHAHVNHGESDKLSSFSNQVRAYHRVFVAGANAAVRYRERLLELDDSKVVQIGRPQLDPVYAPALPPTTLRTLVYAPTWEGELEDNNWTSVDAYGPAVVDALLRVHGARVVYKPHPRVRSTTSAPVAGADAQIRRTLQRASAQRPGSGHAVLDDVEILAVLPGCDALVTDVSTVALDFLYLFPERPLLLTDRRNDRDRLVEETPLAAGVDVVDASTVDSLTELLEARLVDDVRLPDREQLRKRYFGDLHRGESTARFVAAVDELCHERDRLVAARPSSRPGAEKGRVQA